MPQDSRAQSPHLPGWLAPAAAAVDRLKVGGNLVYRGVTSSTNDDARALAVQGAPDGLVVLADEQSHGRGRLGRAWHAPPDSSLLLSVLFRRALPLEQASRLTMLVALAALDAIEQVAGLRGELKWPNDIMLEGRKVGGILTELERSDGRLRWAVVGLGLNVNVDFDGHPELRETATSLRSATGGEVDRGELLVALLRGLSVRYSRLIEGHSPVEEWQGRLATLGKQVEVACGDEVILGLADVATAEGTLILRLEDGSHREIHAGDVKLRETVK